MTPEQIAVAKSSDLAAIKAMVPAEVEEDAVDEKGGSSILSLNIQYHKCTDEGHAVIEYLIEQGASPNQENAMVQRLDQMVHWQLALLYPAISMLLPCGLPCYYPDTTMFPCYHHAATLQLP